MQVRNISTDTPIIEPRRMRRAKNILGILAPITQDIDKLDFIVVFLNVPQVFSSGTYPITIYPDPSTLRTLDYRVLFIPILASYHLIEFFFNPFLPLFKIV